MTVDPGIVQIAIAVIGAVVSIQLAKITAQGVIAAKKVEQVAVKTAEAAVKVAEVKDTLVATAAETTNMLGDIKTLVNGAMAAQMKISAVALRRVADRDNHPDDIVAAELAEKTYQDHMNNQPGKGSGS